MTPFFAKLTLFYRHSMLQKAIVSVIACRGFLILWLKPLESDLSPTQLGSSKSFCSAKSSEPIILSLRDTRFFVRSRKLKFNLRWRVTFSALWLVKIYTLAILFKHLLIILKSLDSLCHKHRVCVISMRWLDIWDLIYTSWWHQIWL